MGDKRRFKEFALLIAKLYPDKSLTIADVAGGKGQLQMELRCLGYRNVVTFDKRNKKTVVRKARRKMQYKQKWFDSRIATSYDLIIGMHPDEATDHIIIEASKRRVPFLVCPCCIEPSAVTYRDRRTYKAWYGHLKSLAHRLKYRTNDKYLNIRGKNKVLVGVPT
jgi:hypothetical protein